MLSWFLHPDLKRSHATAREAAGFALAHGAVGVLGAAFALAWITAFPGAGPWRWAAVGTFAVPLALAVGVRLTPRVAILQALSGLSSTGLIAGLAALTGGLTSPFLPWLLLLPAEAALVRRTRHFLVMLGAACTAAGLLTGLGHWGFLPASRVPAGWEPALMGLSVLAAVLYGGALVMQIRREQATEDRERAIAEASARFLDEHVGDLVLRVSDAERIAYAGPAAAGLLGAGAAGRDGDLYGMALLDLVPAGARQRLKHALVRAAYFGERSQSELCLEDAAGRKRWLDVLCRPLETAPPAKDFWRRKGKTWAQTRAADVLVVGRDVSAVKRETAQLARAKLAAEARSKAKSLFLANMSHELRTPLNSILGFAQVIDGELFGPIENRKYKEYAGLIEESGRYLLELINDILDLSKVEAGKYHIETGEVNMPHVLERTLRLMAPQYREKGLKLAAEVAPDLPVAAADPRCARQILFNLLSNALKFTQEGGSVTVRLFRDPQGVALSVCDTGVGISPAELARLANPFEQSSSALTTDARGTGLGLALVRRLAELQGGRFAIESAPGKGTEVTVAFPLGAAAQSPGRLSAAA